MFIPIGDDNSRRTQRPVVVWVLFAVNAAVWILQLALGETFTYGFSTVPFEITHGVDLIEPRRMAVGGGFVDIPHYPGPVPIQLTLVSAMFMHGSWMHIIGNMVYLLVFGDQIEDLLGRFRFALFYLGCGLAAGLSHVLAGTDSVVPSLGASGAIAGVLGAYLLTYPKNSVYVVFITRIVPLPAFIVLGGWLVLQLVGQVSLSVASAAGGVAYMAHLGGFVAGALLIATFGRRLRRARPTPDGRFPTAARPDPRDRFRRD